MYGINKNLEFFYFCSIKDNPNNIIIINKNIKNGIIGNDNENMIALHMTLFSNTFKFSVLLHPCFFSIDQEVLQKHELNKFVCSMVYFILLYVKNKSIFYFFTVNTHLFITCFVRAFLCIC